MIISWLAKAQPLSSRKRCIVDVYKEYGIRVSGVVSSFMYRETQRLQQMQFISNRRFLATSVQGTQQLQARL